jgi:hypothetical protein
MAPSDWTRILKQSSFVEFAVNDMRPYGDTNFLVSLYLEVGRYERAGTVVAEAQALGMEALPMPPLLAIELTNAFQLHVFLSQRQGQWRVAPELAGAVQAIFEEDVRNSSLFCEEDMPGRNCVLPLKNSRLDIRQSMDFARTTFSTLRPQGYSGVTPSGALMKRPEILQSWKDSP